jgi:RNA polymerase sigma factor (sigma-70 family)
MVKVAHFSHREACSHHNSSFAGHTHWVCFYAGRTQVQSASTQYQLLSGRRVSICLFVVNFNFSNFIGLQFRADTATIPAQKASPVRCLLLADSSFLKNKYYSICDFFRFLHTNYNRTIISYFFVDKTQQFLKALNEHKGLIFKIASIYSNNIDDRNDLTQEIIYQFWKSFDNFSQKSSLTTWIYRLAMNVAIYHLKIGKRKIQAVPLDEQIIAFYEVDNEENEEKWLLLKRHIDNLNLLDKGIVVLYLDNKSYEEIGQIVGISTSNVGTKLSRIKDKLKGQILNNY